MTQQPETRRQTIEQQRGRQAWANIGEIKRQRNKDLEKKYRSLARGLNAMIQTNGLGQTLGFFYAKGRQTKDEHFHLLNHLTQWMQMNEYFGHLITSQPTQSAEDNKLLLWVTRSANTAEYRLATTECLAFGNWLRRFAEAELEGEA